MTLLEKFHCILSNTGLSKSFSIEALVYACHLINKLPSSATGGKTPLKVWLEKVAQDYNLLSNLVPCQGRQIGSESEERCVHGFQEMCERL